MTNFEPDIKSVAMSEKIDSPYYILFAALPGDTVSYKKDTIAIPNGQVWLEGDNKKESLDSRHFGTVPIGLLQGVVMFSLNPLKKIE